MYLDRFRPVLETPEGEPRAIDVGNTADTNGDGLVCIPGNEGQSKKNGVRTYTVIDNIVTS